MRYNYLARTKKGEIQTGSIEANSESAAIEILQSHDLVVVAIESGEKKSFFSKKIKIFERITRKDIMVFCQQLAILVGSEVPLVQSLKSLASQAEKITFKEIIAKIAVDVEGGMLLSKALAKHPKVFSDFYINLVKSGEAAGRLQASLEFLADHLEKEYYLISKVQRAMYYPGFILGSFIIIAVIMLVWVVPGLIEFLEGLGGELPLPTRIIMVISNFLRSFGWLILLVLIIIGVALQYYFKTASGKKLLDELKLKIPIFGKIFKKTYLAHFTKNLSTLVKGGLPIIQALDISGRVVGNSIFQNIIFKARDEVSKGNTISGVFEKEALIPPVVSQMIRTGEKTGRLDYILENLSDFYTREVDNIVDNLSELIEPVLIVILGVGVGILMAAILMPMYSLTSSLGA